MPGRRKIGACSMASISVALPDPGETQALSHQITREDGEAEHERGGMSPVEDEEHGGDDGESAQAKRAGDQPTTGCRRPGRGARGIADEPPEAADGQGAA